MVPPETLDPPDLLVTLDKGDLPDLQDQMETLVLLELPEKRETLDPLEMPDEMEVQGALECPDDRETEDLMELLSLVLPDQLELMESRERWEREETLVPEVLPVSRESLDPPELLEQESWELREKREALERLVHPERLPRASS